MKAIVINKAGLSEELKLTECPKPKISPNQVLVKVYAASVNQIDWKRASGQMGAAATPSFPWIPGYDFAGIIKQVGGMVEGFAVGEEVFGCSNGGAYAEYIAADAGVLARKPEKLSFVEAAGASFVAVTALQALFLHGKLLKGQRVLIHGSAGAVGAYAVQLARVHGAKIYATATGRDAGFVRSMGADTVIDYLMQDFTEQAKGMDLVIDLVGGDTLHRSYSVLRQGGRLVTLVGAADEKLTAEFKVEVVRMGVKPAAEDLRTISRMFDEEKLKCDIAKVFSLSQARKAWDYVLGNDPSKTHGKVVLQVI